MDIYYHTFHRTYAPCQTLACYPEVMQIARDHKGTISHNNQSLTINQSNNQ